MARMARFGTLTCLLAVLAHLGMCATASAVQLVEDPKYSELESWVISNGGMSKGRIGINGHGVRGLFAKETIPAGEIIMSIPGSVILNAGSARGSFLTPSLSVLREQLHPHSRFKPYMDFIPKGSEVLNACNLEDKYWHLFESQYWHDFIFSWQSYLARALEGLVNEELEITIPEMLGNVTDKLTVDDLKGACALSATRYVESGTRARLLMVPIFDLANHDLRCENYLTSYADSDVIHLIAGKDIKEGGEICYSYGSLRDDYAIVHYGFLPALEDPPRLLLEDHHQFDATQHHQHITEEIFPGTTPEAVQAELERLKHIQAVLAQLDEDAKTHNTRPPKGTSPASDLLLELQSRRRNAIKAEITRLQGLLAKPEL